MALSMGVVATDVIYIDDTPLVVKSLAEGTINVSVDGVNFEINEDSGVQVKPNVYLSCEASFAKGASIVRLVFDAPRSVVILRKKLYDKSKQGEFA